MDYFEYINDIKPNSDFKNNTKARIQLEILKQNIKRRNAKKAYISMAACFIVLIASIFTAGALTKNSEYIENSTEKTTESLFSETISVHMNTDEAEAEPQEILIGKKLYLQYRNEDLKKSENNQAEINKADIGELLCTIDESNLVSAMKTLGGSETKGVKKNKFCNAEVYRLKNYENDTVVLVKEKDKEKYYLFYLTDKQ